MVAVAFPRPSTASRVQAGRNNKEQAASAAAKYMRRRVMAGFLSFVRATLPRSELLSRETTARRVLGAVVTFRKATSHTWTPRAVPGGPKPTTLALRSHAHAQRS